MKLLILFIFLWPCKLIAQVDSFYVGDHYIITNKIWSNIHPWWREKLDIKKLSYDIVWTMDKFDATDILFRTSASDSFWYPIKQLNEDLFHYKIFPFEAYKKYEKKYTKPVMRKVFNAEVWIGMNWQLLMFAKGYPDKINKTTTARGTDEQWIYGVYSLSYYYLSNGKLTTIQD